MRKFFYLIPIPLLVLIALVFNSKHRYSEDHTPYKEVIAHQEFNLIVFYDESDLFFTQKIHSMIDQEYDNYQIHLIIGPNDKEIGQKTQIYAHKAGKGHLLSIIENNNFAPELFIFNKIVNKLGSESYIIYLENNCTFIDNTIIKALNELTQNKSNLLIFSSYINYPSYQQNKEILNFNTSHFKAFCISLFKADDISPYINMQLSKSLSQMINEEAAESHYIEKSLYLRQRS